MPGTVIGEHSGAMSIPISGINAGTTGDTLVQIPFGNYIVRRVMVTGASANLLLTTATASLRTAAAGAGNAVVSLQALTALIAANVVSELALALTTAQTSPTLYFRIVQGLTPVAGTINAVIEIQPLP